MLALSFIPQDRRQALALGRTLPERTEGAALFADISGFTRLTESLARTLGPLQGAEALTSQLARIYTALVGAVDAYQGSVIGFSGDAITCWFDRDDGTRAVAAGLAMQEAMRPFAALSLPGGQTSGLFVKVAVACGPVRRFVVGEARHSLIDVLAGRTLDTLAAAEGLAQSGEVLIAGGEELAQRFVVAEWREVASGQRVARVGALRSPVAPWPWPELAPGALTDEQLSAWLLPAVYERLQQGEGEFLAGFRPAAALFLSFRGIDYDADDDAGSKLDAFVDFVQDVIARYEGAIIQLTIGDKGSYLYAAFGAPIAHRDDAVRAVAVALELQKLPDRLAFIHSLRIGLTYGQMYTGAYGSASRRTYGVLSHKTNLSARLMNSAGPGGILCDTEIRQRAGEKWAFETLPPIKVKGKDEPVAVFSPTGELATAQADTSPLVGRGEDVARLQGVLEALGDGTGGVVGLEGEAGIGKSRLAQELERLGREQGAEVLFGAGQSIERELPYRAWRDVLEGYFGLEDAMTPAAQLERVQAVVQQVAPQLLGRSQLLGDVLSLAGGDLPAASSDASVRQEGLFELLIALLRHRAQERPLVLILEDAQWLDSLSWEFAERVARQLCAEERCVLVIVSRSLEDVDAPPLSALKALASTWLALAPLSPEAVSCLVAQQLEVAPGALPGALASLIQERSGGNPFVAEELTRALLERGLLRVEETQAGRAVYASAAEASSVLPDTLQGLILSRFDQLPPEQQMLLKIAAVIGRTFASSALHDTATQVKASFRPHYVRELIRHGFIQSGAREQDLLYAFRHIITHEAVYAALLFSQRRRVHRAVAEWYEATYPERLQDFTSILAYHYGNAAHGAQDEQLIAKAASYLEEVIAQDTLLGAYREGVSASRRLLELLPDDARWRPKRAEALVRLGSLHERMGNYASAEEFLASGLQLARESGAGKVQVEALSRACLVYTRQGKYASARDAGEEALKLAQETGEASFGLALAHSSLGIIAAYQGDLSLARTHFASGLEVSRQLNDLDQSAHLLNNLGLVAIYQEAYASAQTHLDEALALARRFDNRGLMVSVMANLGIVAEKQGDYPLAEQRYQEGLSLSQDMGARWQAVDLALSLGGVALAQNQEERAWHLYINALTDAYALNALPTALLALPGLAALLSARGRSQTAAELLGLAMYHPASNTEIEQNVAPVLERLKADLAPEQLEAALQRGRVLELTVVAEQLHLLN